MSTTNYAQETSESIPFEKYFEFFPCDTWSLRHFVTLVIGSYIFAEKEKTHRSFYNTLSDINNNFYVFQEVRDITQNLIKSRKVSISRITNSVWWGLCQVLVSCTYYLRHNRSPTSTEMSAFITCAIVNIMGYASISFSKDLLIPEKDSAMYLSLHQ